MIQRVCLGPYLEMFARDRSPMFQTRDGWEVWGDQCTASIELPFYQGSTINGLAQVSVEEG